jgi:peptide chain release factor
MNSDNFLTRLEAVNLRLSRLGVRETDLSEQFIHSGGKGGQNVNKVSTAVRLSYAPAGLVRRSGFAAKAEDVKCMEERSQLLNRVRAREILADRLDRKRDNARLYARAEAEKLRKQKAGRPRSIKRRILRDKRRNSLMKKNRSWRGGGDD